jgi:Tol biopolymer transport system component
MSFFAELVSVADPVLQSNSITGSTGDLSGAAASISADGRYVVFASTATNLVAGDTNNAQDVFRWDTTTGTVDLVSVDVSGTGVGDAASENPQISSDGRYVVFESDANNLVAIANNSFDKIFIRDLQTGTTTLVSENQFGGSGSSSRNPVVSSDGRYVLFTSSDNNLVANDTNGGNFSDQDVFLRDVQAGTTTLISVNNAGTDSGNASSQEATMSRDGRYVVFSSNASDLVANDTNNASDVFLRDVQTGVTTLVSINGSNTGSGNAGSFSPAVSDDGRYVVFISLASDLAGTDTNGVYDVYLRDLQAGITTLVSTNLSGTDSGNGYAFNYRSQISPDGRYVVFQSVASDLVANDSNGLEDVFVYDIQTNTTRLLSGNVLGTGSGNGSSELPALSRDGNFVVFVSHADDLAGGDNNGLQDVFLYNLQTDTTTLISTTPSNTSGNGASYAPLVSEDGQQVAFFSYASDLLAGDTTAHQDLFLRDLQTSTTDLLSLNNITSVSGNDRSYNFLPFNPRYSQVGGNGRYVVFSSFANNLVANDTDNLEDVFLRDLVTGTTTLVSDIDDAYSSSGAPVISENGRYVAFYSLGNYVALGDTNSSSDVYVWDRTTGDVTLVSVASDGTASQFRNSTDGLNLAITHDGRYVAFESDANNLVAGDTNTELDVFVRDRQLGTTTLVSRNSAGTGSGNGASELVQLTDDGRYALFTSNASDLVTGDSNNARDIFVRDLVNGTTSLVSINSSGTGTGSGTSGTSDVPMMSANGRYVVFRSAAINLVANDLNNATDIFVRDLVAGTTTLVSENASGTGSGNAGASNSLRGPAISADGRYVVFASDASDLVANDGNGSTDVFLRDLTTNTTTLISVNQSGTDSGNNASLNPMISRNGRFIIFSSSASDLVSGDTNGYSDIFVRDLQTGTTSLISVDQNGELSDASSNFPFISPDGSYVTFTSNATNLVGNDLNQASDVFGVRLLPTVTDIQPSSSIITDAIATFTLTLSYSDEMNPAIAPTIAFPTAGEDPSSTITLLSGNWTNTTTYIASYSVTDTDQVLPNIDTEITGAEALSGEIPPTAIFEDVFTIDTTNPPDAPTPPDNPTPPENPTPPDTPIPPENPPGTGDPSAPPMPPPVLEFGTAPAAINFRQGRRGIRLRGTQDNDTLVGTGRTDALNGLNGRDRMAGRGGSDRMDGGKGRDLMVGNGGRDLLIGGAGNDWMHGGGGDDILVGGTGNDTLTGGRGSDLFVFKTLRDRVDTIKDFNPTEDLIDLSKLFAKAQFRGIDPVIQLNQFIQFVQVGSTVQLRIDEDGTGLGTNYQTLVKFRNLEVGAIASRNIVMR